MTTPTTGSTGSGTARALLPERASAILEMAHKLTKLDATYIAAIDLAGDRQEVLHASSPPGINIDEGASWPWPDSICRHAAGSGQWDTDDVERDLPESAVAAELGVRSYIGVPITDPDNRLIATLCGVSRDSRPATSVARSGLLILARLIAEQWESTPPRPEPQPRAEELETVRALTDRATALAESEHQLKSPLTIITGWAETLLDRPDTANDAELLRGLNAIVRASRRATAGLDTLILETRGLGRASVAEPADVLTAVPTDMSELVAEVADDLGRLLGPAHRLRTRIDAGIHVHSDREALHQVLWHLSENAVKYSPDGGSITLHLDQPDPDTARFTITDQGIGIPPGTDAFAAFVRGPNTAGIPGTGLGLHVVQRLTHIMGGAIALEAADPGTTFILTLPAV